MTRHDKLNDKHKERDKHKHNDSHKEKTRGNANDQFSIVGGSRY